MTAWVSKAHIIFQVDHRHVQILFIGMLASLLSQRSSRYWEKEAQSNSDPQDLQARNVLIHVLFSSSAVLHEGHRGE